MSTIGRLAVLFVGILALVALAPGVRTAAAATIQINITDNLFCGTTQPCITNVQVGDTVHWVWMGSNPHSTTSDVSSTQVWDSGQHGNGFTFDQTFNTSGSYSYHCTVHPNMHGTIVVVQSVGGIAELPNVATAPLAQPASNGGNGVLIVGLSAAAAGVLVLGTAGWYVRRRRAP